jgi:hypothetical protein
LKLLLAVMIKQRRLLARKLIQAVQYQGIFTASFFNVNTDRLIKDVEEMQNSLLLFKNPLLVSVMSCDRRYFIFHSEFDYLSSPSHFSLSIYNIFTQVWSISMCIASRSDIGNSPASCRQSSVSKCTMTPSTQTESSYRLGGRVATPHFVQTFDKCSGADIIIPLSYIDL